MRLKRLDQDLYYTCIRCDFGYTLNGAIPCLKSVLSIKSCQENCITACVAWSQHWLIPGKRSQVYVLAYSV